MNLLDKDWIGEKMKDDSKKVISLLNNLIKKVGSLKKTLDEHADQLDHVHWLINTVHYSYYKDKKAVIKPKL